MVAEGRPIKAIAAARRTTARGGRRRGRGALPQAGRGRVARASDGALRRLRLLHKAIVDREEQGETLSAGCCPAAWPRSCGASGGDIGETERARSSPC